MTIRVDAYTTGGMASGTLASPGGLRDALETDGELSLDGAAWQGLDDPVARPTGPLSIRSDDVLVAVADDDPGIPVHRPGTASTSNRARTRSRASWRPCPASTRVGP